MRKIVKNLVVFSMVGLMQVGLFASAAEAAAPRPGDPPGYEHRNDQHQRDIEKEKERRIQEENRRHEHEMKRRPHESKRDWHERQEREKERHERAIYEIMHRGPR
ncbi:hypothetical protein [Sporomusa aerivorans]|uniref:hypothetical protein n=1 Tax=Sporomusa aerivorans TaxID=204936 RepID=UPI00352A08F8